MTQPAGVEVTGPRHDRYDEVLTPEALGFLAQLHRAFEGRRRELLARRTERDAELAAGGTLDFLDATKDVREGDWRGARPAPGPGDPPGGGTRPTHPQKDHQPPQPRAEGGGGP